MFFVLIDLLTNQLFNTYGLVLPEIYIIFFSTKFKCYCAYFFPNFIIALICLFRKCLATLSITNWS